ncbi:hypothetical protein MNBD_UNCLBAC01-1256 [hydrothermal vent metagenome]|uniref:histidine kinase n=1 Tax=hydrothermal vent metagenome TaxID=652676 RepID=A0A3B1D7Q3_9ZZZZ
MRLHKTLIDLSCFIYFTALTVFIWFYNQIIKIWYTLSVWSPSSVVLLGNFFCCLSRVLHFIQRLFKKIFSFLFIPSIYFEIRVLYTSILGIILIIFSGVMYLMLFRMVYSELDQELNLTAMNVKKSIVSYVSVRGEDKKYLIFAVEKTIASEGERLTRWWITGFQKQWLQKNDQLDLSKNFINFVSSEGKSLITSKNLSKELIPLFLEKYSVSDVEGVNYQNILFQGRQIRIINYPFIFTDEDVYTIQVGIYRQRIVDFIFNWLNSIIYSIPSILILTSFIGRILVKRILKPVEEISSTASRISREDLRSRVQIKKPYVEMTHLVDNFNNMITRLEKSFTHIEEFSSHVAHEIKTPLTILKGETELALLGERTTDEYKRVLLSNMEETDRIFKIVEDLLLLTKLNYESENFKFEKIDFNAYIQNIYDQTLILAKPKKIKFELFLPQNPITMQMDKTHLRRLFFNIIDNALKFTPINGKITITVRSIKHSVIVSIADTGGGIAKEDIPKIFERFYRRNREKSGCGLGLSIVQSIIKLHQGTIDVTSQLHRGTTFIISFPATVSS